MPKLFRLKLFHARHFPQAVFHPLLFFFLLFAFFLCFKMQPKISAVSESEVMAEWENLGGGAIFGSLESFGRGIWKVGAGLGLGDQLARYSDSSPWQTRVRDCRVCTKMPPVRGARSRSPCPERTFCPKSLTLPRLSLALASQRSKVWEITMPVCFFSPLSILLHRKSLSLQVKFKKI